VKNNYTIKELVNVFHKHSLEFQDNQKEIKRVYLDNYGKEDTNEYFDISSALCLMCKEIQKLKDKNVV